MKKLTLLLALVASQALAGEGSVGNGGTAVVCRDSKKNIESAQLVDRDEARKAGVEIFTANGMTKTAYMVRATNRLSFNSLLQADAGYYIGEIASRQRDVKSEWLYKPGAIREVLPPLNQPG